MSTPAGRNGVVQERGRKRGEADEGPESGVDPESRGRLYRQEGGPAENDDESWTEDWSWSERRRRRWGCALLWRSGRISPRCCGITGGGFRLRGHVGPSRRFEYSRETRSQYDDSNREGEVDLRRRQGVRKPADSRECELSEKRSRSHVPCTHRYSLRLPIQISAVDAATETTM